MDEIGAYLYDGTQGNVTDRVVEAVSQDQYDKQTGRVQ
jgi:hypothetical protein